MCKTTQIHDFPLKILKLNADIFTANICNFFSVCVNEGKIPNIFKQTNVTVAFKIGYRGSKDSYPPIDILPAIAKIFEKLLSKQEAMFMDQFLSK